MRSTLNLKKQFDWYAISTCAGNVSNRDESKLNRCVFLDFAPKKFESLPTLFLISHLFCFCSLIANSYLDLNLAKKKYYDTLNLIITSHPHHYFGSLLPISLWSFAATSLILFKITLYFILLSFLFTF